MAFEYEADGIWQLPGVTRFEVIDHRSHGIGRVYAIRPCSVDISYQDSGKTVKIFLRDPVPGVKPQG